MESNKLNIEIIILAAGKGIRMYSSIPKVLHEVGSQSLLNHVIDKSKSNSCYKCILDCDAALEKYYLDNGFIKKGLYMAKYF